MSQQVNLYHPIFRKQEKRFSARTMAQAAAIVAAGIAVLTLAQWWNLRSLRSTIDSLEQQRAGLEQTANRFRGTSRETDPLAQKVVRLERLLTARTRLQEALRQDEFSNMTGYSDYMMALGRQSIPGMWITGFRITGAGRQVILQGRSYAPELVPRFIQNLSREKSFGGIEFRIFRMDRPATGQGRQLENYVEFIASTLDENELKALK